MHLYGKTIIIEVETETHRSIYEKLQMYENNAAIKNKYNEQNYNSLLLLF